MAHRNTWILALFMAAPPAACMSSPSPSLPAADFVAEAGKPAHNYLSRFSDWGYAGSVVVVKDGKVVLANGYGLADRASQRPNTANSVFTIGSVTKQFTGAAILTLEQAGKISVDDPITAYLDKVPEDKREITIHQLLTHSAGIASGIGDDFDVSLSREEFLRAILDTPLEFPPGERHEYSNAGYSILGIILEKVSGTGYEEYLYEHLFKPAGMNRTGYLRPEYRDEELATGYRDGEPWGVVIRKAMLPDGPSWNLRANGGIHSTALDMARWHFTLQGEEVLSAASKRKLFAPHIPEMPGGDSYYGYGWAIFDSPHGKLIAHNGGNGIFSADFRHYVDQGLMFFVTCNACYLPGADIDQISDRIARVVLDGDLEPAPRTVDLTPERAEQLAGRYTISGDGGALTVTAQEGSLFIEPDGSAAFSAIFPAANEQQAAVAAAFVKGMVESSARGDYAQLQQALSWAITPEEAEQMGKDYWQELRDSYGELESIDVLGVLPAADSIVAVFVRNNLSKGTIFARYDIQDKTVRDMNAFMESLPGAMYRSNGDGRFVTFDFDTGASQTFTVEAGGIREATTLHFQRDGDEIVARRAP